MSKVYCCTHLLLYTSFQVPPPVPKKPNVLLLPSSTPSSTNGNTECQIPQTDSPVGLQSPEVAFVPEGFPGTSVPYMLEPDENHVGMDEDSSKESSLQDSAIIELEGKLACTGIGEGTDSDCTDPSFTQIPCVYTHILEPFNVVIAVMMPEMVFKQINLNCSKLDQTKTLVG